MLNSKASAKNFQIRQVLQLCERNMSKQVITLDSAYRRLHSLNLGFSIASAPRDEFLHISKGNRHDRGRGDGAVRSARIVRRGTALRSFEEHAKAMKDATELNATKYIWIHETGRLLTRQLC